MNLIISGLGQISAAGQGIKSLWEGVQNSKISKLTEREVLTREGPRTIATLQVEDFNLPTSIPDGVARRMSRLSKMCFSAVHEALDDANLNPAKSTERFGLIVGTAFGAFDLAIALSARVQLEGPLGASPILFTSSVQNSIASHLSISLKITGPTTTLMTMEHTAIGSLRLAYDWLLQNRADHVVVVMGDEISDYHSYYMAHRKRVNALDYQSDECTTILGEGAVCVILSRESALNKKNNYARIQSIDLFSAKETESQLTLIASGCHENQWSLYQKFFSDASVAKCHIQLYGSFVTNAAFEIAIAALLTKNDQKIVRCLQITNANEKLAIQLQSV